MYTLKIAMNICSNGTPESREGSGEPELIPQTDDSPMGRLEYHRTLWQLSGFDTYQYTLSRSCFAMPESEIRVRVEAGRVISAFSLPEASLAAEAHNVDEYFDLIQRALNADLNSVNVEYHPTYGYPLSIAIAQRQSVSEMDYRTA